MLISPGIKREHNIRYSNIHRQIETECDEGFRLNENLSGIVLLVVFLSIFTFTQKYENATKIEHFSYHYMRKPVSIWNDLLPDWNEFILFWYGFIPFQNEFIPI